MSTPRAKLARSTDERRVRVLLALFFVALAAPTALLVARAREQLRWEAFRALQLAADDVARSIDAALAAAVAAEEARSFGDYAFLVVEGDAAVNFVQRSPLSAYPVESRLPGVVGYFQVDPDGALTTPLLPGPSVDPAAYGIAPDERAARLRREAELRDVLVENRLVQGGVTDGDAARREAADDLRRATVADDAVRDGAPAEAANAAPSAPPLAAEPQRAFDRLARAAPAEADAEQGPADGVRAQLRQLSELDLSAPFDDRAASVTAAAPQTAAAGEREKRSEQGLMAEPDAAADPAPSQDAARAAVRVRTFDSELEPFELGLLDTGHLVLFRNAWRDGRRYVQGMLLDRERFVAEAIERAFAASSLAGAADVIVALGGNVLDVAAGAPAPRAYGGPPAGTLLHRARMSPPFSRLELVFAVERPPRGQGEGVLAWVAAALAAVLCGGFLLMHRFAVGQIRLNRQQQDFVSAVSHELKTPLTSIRLYGEMLEAGWADEARKQTYYEYIHAESERLSRLIDNVLELARLTRRKPQLEVQRVAVAQLLDGVRAKVATQVERAGFDLTVRDEAPAATVVRIDPDRFTQIVINLVDNALKFAAGAERKTVEIAARRERDGSVLFTVRDFGPGVPKRQMKKIFELFYRPENELTRETVGTGIGLALVRELTEAMGGRVDVRNCAPGAEFRLSFPAADAGERA